MTTSDSSKVTVTVRGDADVHVTPRSGGPAHPPPSATEVAAAEDFDTKGAALAAAHKQGRPESAVYHEKGRWHVAKEATAAEEDHTNVVVASFKSHPHASKHCAEAATEVKTLSKHVHWRQDHGIFLGKGQLTPSEYLVEPQQHEGNLTWVLYLIKHKARGRRELVYLTHSHTIARVMLKADTYEETVSKRVDRDEITQETRARELVTAAAERAPTSREGGASECACPHGGAEVDKLAPGYYAIAPDGSVMSGPFDTYSPAKQSASRLNGYVRFAAEHAAGEKNGGRGGGYCIPYIRMVRDADAYEECIGAWNKGGRRIASARDVYEALHAKLAKEDQEVFLVVLADVRGQCIGVDEVARGARDRVDVDIARVFASVAVYRPHHYIVVHNHPSRKANPSQADKDLTKTIEEAARPFSRSSAFVDHVVIGMGEYYSFADGKLHHVKESKGPR
jgi:RadC-like JAB domain